MMLTILGLPTHIKYPELKILIKQQCNINDFILDNILSVKDGSKKVRIGLTNERDGVQLLKGLDGYRMGGNVLKVIPVGQTQTSPLQKIDTIGGYNQHHHMNQSSRDYNGPTQPVESKLAPWTQNTNQWAPNQNVGNQPIGSQMSNQFGSPNFQPQTQMLNTPFMQHPGSQSQQRQDVKFGQRDYYDDRMRHPEPGYGLQPKNDMPATGNYFHGETQYNSMHSQNMGQYQGQGHLGQGQQGHGHSVAVPQVHDLQRHGPQIQGHQGQSHPAPWLSQSQQQKPTQFSPQSKAGQPFENRELGDARKFSSLDKRSAMIKGPQEHDNYKSFYTSNRFSPEHNKHQHEKIVPSLDRRISPSGRRLSPPGRRISPSGRRISPSERRLSPSGRRISPSGRRISPSERRMSPPRRGMSPSGRRISPSGRRMSPSGRRMSPSGRRISPFGLRISPSGRRISPSGRRMSPTDRNMPPSGRNDRHPIRHSPTRPDSSRRRSPPRTHSPGRRTGSPNWRKSPVNVSMRYSPSRRHVDSSAEKYGGRELQAPLKMVTPAYDSSLKASNQQMYTGGYGPNLHENVQYPTSSPRTAETASSSWKGKDKHSFSLNVKNEGDKRDKSRMQSFEMPRGAELRVERMDSGMEAKRGHSSSLKSRSPLRRERSPVRERYRRHSPSPRSPRRSWALEKRRSPDIREPPPPPVWPGQDRKSKEYPRTNRPTFDRPDVNDKSNISSWEKEKDGQRDTRNPEEKQKWRPMGRDRSDLPSTSGTSRREPSPRDRFKPKEELFLERELKTSPEEDFYHRGSKFRQSNDVERKNDNDSREKLNRMMERDDRRGAQKREYNSSEQDKIREGYHKQSEELTRQIDEIHRRAKEFRKKTEEYRKNEERRKEYSEERVGHDEADRHNIKRYEKRPKSIQIEESHHRDEVRHEWTRHNLENSQDNQSGSPDSGEKRKPDKIGDDMRQMTPSIRLKREKAAEEIAQNIFKRKNLPVDIDRNRRVFDELKHTLCRKLHLFFGNKDVSFIELIIKFKANYGDSGEDKIFNEVMSSFSNKLRKRQIPDGLEVPAKLSRISSEDDGNRDNIHKQTAPVQMPDWNLNIGPPNMQPLLIMPPQYQAMSALPMMVPVTNYTSTFEEVQSQMSTYEETSHQNVSQDIPENAGTFHLYLCKDDFEPFTDIQAEYLRQYLIELIRNVTEVSDGWCPDFTLKGLQSMHRFEVVTQDETSRDWLLNVDFSGFRYFSVLVYTKGELWYERAAIWLPGHSKYRKTEPLDKLKLQNKKLTDVNIGKWKLVKKIVTPKGIRIYVDMPPASARALEKYDMKVSYELQKVSVFLKAVAVDKDAFDAGLQEISINDDSEILKAASNTPMPSLPLNPDIVKIALKGNKTCTIPQARKFKEMIIYNIFKYHHGNGKLRTDFIQYGYCMPGYFGVLPENEESRKWITELQIGNLKKHPIIVIGFDDRNSKFIQMTITVKQELNLKQYVLLERLKHCNQGLKGVNFHLWKSVDIIHDKKRIRWVVDMDLESIENLSKLRFQLDYVQNRFAYITYKDGRRALDNLIKKYKAELEDTCDLADMDLASSEDEDTICLD